MLNVFVQIVNQDCKKGKGAGEDENYSAEWLVVITDDYHQIAECICANSRLDLSRS